jgi:hypothetical protein
MNISELPVSVTRSSAMTAKGTEHRSRMCAVSVPDELCLAESGLGSLNKQGLEPLTYLVCGEIVRSMCRLEGQASSPSRSTGNSFLGLFFRNRTSM